MLPSEHKRTRRTGKKTALFEKQMLKLERSMEEGRERIIVSRARQEFTHVSMVKSFMPYYWLSPERMIWSWRFTFSGQVMAYRSQDSSVHSIDRDGG